MSVAKPLRVTKVKEHWAVMEDGRVVDTRLVGEVKKGDMLMVSRTVAVSKLSSKALQLMNKWK